MGGFVTPSLYRLPATTQSHEWVLALYPSIRVPHSSRVFARWVGFRVPHS